jgi:metal-responsive CopG/Arc/MetJ family transcriptional regulator
VVEFPEPLFRRAEQAAVELAIDRSTLIRSAVEHHLERLRQRRLEAELAAGYAANANLNREIAEEFAGLEEEGR